MELRASARQAFRATFFSGWGVLLGLSLILHPAMVAVQLLVRPGLFGGGPTARAVAVDIVLQADSYLPWIGPAVILMAMVASGAWGPAASPRGAFLGRAGALAALVLVAWALPVLVLVLPRAGVAGIYPLLLATAIQILPALAWVALFSVVAELGLRAPGLAATGLWFALAAALDLLRFTLAAMFFFAEDTYASVAFWTSFLSPEGVAQGLQGATFPRSSRFGTLEEQPPLYGIPIHVVAALLWIVVPLIVLLAGERTRPTLDADEELA